MEIRGLGNALTRRARKVRDPQRTQGIWLTLSSLPHGVNSHEWAQLSFVNAVKKDKREMNFEEKAKRVQYALSFNIFAQRASLWPQIVVVNSSSG